MDITSYFANPSPWGIGLALLFGAVWLAGLKPLNLRRPGPWLVLIVGAVLFAPSISWVQVPIQRLIGNALTNRFGILTYQSHLLLTSIPVVLVSGLVQEGAKLLPVSIYWSLKHRSLLPRAGLTVGAMAGIGFGFVEAQWVLNSIFASGWSIRIFQIYGFAGIAGFFERFFTVGFHAASAALAGWGLSKGYGWQSYLLVSFLHFLLNYTTVFYQKNLVNTTQIETIIAVMASAIFAAVVCLRYLSRHPAQQE